MLNYDKRFYINTHLTNQSGDDCASAITRDWHTRNKSASAYARPFETRFASGPSRLNAESSSRCAALHHGNKKYFYPGWKSPDGSTGSRLHRKHRASISSLWRRVPPTSKILLAGSISVGRSKWITDRIKSVSIYSVWPFNWEFWANAKSRYCLIAVSIVTCNLLTFNIKFYSFIRSFFTQKRIFFSLSRYIINWINVTFSFSRLIERALFALAPVFHDFVAVLLLKPNIYRAER